ncbi:hypothetical protein VB005_04653 [Metarhizium brunneum]
MLLANLLVLATAAVGAVAQYDDVLYDYDEAQSIPKTAAEIYESETCSGSPAITLFTECSNLDPR